MTKGIGTLLWMAPEIMEGSAMYGQPADVYSFGIVLWEITTRSLPWEGKFKCLVLGGGLGLGFGGLGFFGVCVADIVLHVRATAPRPAVTLSSSPPPRPSLSLSPSPSLSSPPPFPALFLAPFLCFFLGLRAR